MTAHTLTLKSTGRVDANCAVAPGTLAGEFNGYPYGDEWSHALVLPDGGGEEIVVPLDSVFAAVCE